MLIAPLSIQCTQILPLESTRPPISGPLRFVRITLSGSRSTTCSHFSVFGLKPRSRDGNSEPPPLLSMCPSSVLVNSSTQIRPCRSWVRSCTPARLSGSAHVCCSPDRGSSLTSRLGTPRSTPHRLPLSVDRDLHDDADAGHAGGRALRIVSRHRPGRRSLLLVRDRVVFDVLRFAERRLVERHLHIGLHRARLLVEPEVLGQVLEDVLAILEAEAKAARIAGEDALTKADPVVFGEIACPSSCRGRTSTPGGCAGSSRKNSHRGIACTSSRGRRGPDRADRSPRSWRT